MSVLAIIPARGGSKGIPGKNLAPVNGVSLVARAVTSALLTRSIARILVSTDDAAISAAAQAAGAEVWARPLDLAGDAASSESALLQVLEMIELSGAELPDIVVFLQATSPFISPADLDGAIARVRSGAEDVVFSVVETYAFLWAEGTGGTIGTDVTDGADSTAGIAGVSGAIAVNHDATFRPRRQDRAPHYRETGAFYVMRTAGFREAEFRFFGRIGLYPVSELSSIEIDTVDELALANAIAPLLPEPGPPVFTSAPARFTTQKEQSWSS